MIDPRCRCLPRRAFLADVGMGFTGLALGAMLSQDGVARADEAAWSPPTGLPHHLPRAKSVIWIFLSGGYSHLETFDPKPALTQYAGKTFDDTPFANPLHSPVHDERSRSVVPMKRDVFPEIFPMQVGFKKYGELGMEVTDWWPHLAGCVDDISFVRSMYTTDNDHAAENQIHTGRHRLDETQPSLGAWVQYGLGSLNDDLPQFVAVGGPGRADMRPSIDSHYLGPQYAGVPLTIGGADALPYGRRPADVLAEEQRGEFELIDELNGLAAVEYPQDEALRARIRSYELAFRMQMAVPEALDLSGETAHTRTLYGFDQDVTRVGAERCLTARRLIERGVRFVQLYPNGYGSWDSHAKLQENHAKLCPEVDQPVAALLKDLKTRGLFDDVLVVFCTEFGRTPGVQTTFSGGARDGRDHHPHGFTVWLAGAGVKRGYIHGATDELGFHAIEPGHYVTDLHATVLHLLGLDGRKLAVPGRKRLEIDFGRPIEGILA